MLHVDPDRCYPDYKTMFDEESRRPDGIQAVSVATPNGTHFEITKAALNAGLHVVCENRSVLRRRRARELEALAAEKNRVVGVTYGYAGHQMIEEARRLIQEGVLGKYALSICSFRMASTMQRWKIRRRPQNGG